MTAPAQTLDLLIRNVRIVPCTDTRCAVLPPGYLAVDGGLIVGFGPTGALDPQLQARREIDCEGALVTPGLIDCHTHLVYAGTRAAEFEQRLEGASYEDIARAGGGILSTVRQTRDALPADLQAPSARRLRELLRHGVTTIESNRAMAWRNSPS